MRMMRWCRQGKIDLILTKSVSRFSRNTVDCLNYIRMLKSLGIGVYFEKENINSMDESTELMLTMMGAFAQAESESISGNIRAGKKYAMQRGEATINISTSMPTKKARTISRRSYRNRQPSCGASMNSFYAAQASA